METKIIDQSIEDKVSELKHAFMLARVKKDTATMQAIVDHCHLERLSGLAEELNAYV